TVASSYNRGDVKNTRNGSDNNDMFYVGGFVAKSAGTLSVSNCFNAGNVSGSYLNSNQVTANANVDNLYFGLASSTNVWYDAGENNKMPNDSRAIYDLVKIATAKGFYSNSTYWSNNAWDFSNVWEIQSGINDSFPYLVANSFVSNDNDLSHGNVLKGQGTVDSPYIIETVADLQYINTILANTTSTYYYALQNDLDLSGNRTWIPIGYSTPFNGVFDGCGHTISGLNSSLNAQFNAVGLFGYTKNAVIKNLTISDFNYVGSSATTVVGSAYIGNLIGRVDGETYVVNCKDNAKTDKVTVGRVLDESLKVFYGQNNLNVNGEIDQNTLKGVNVYVSGYDLKVSGNGGTFYNSNASVYKGDYHVLVDTSKQVVDISNVDASFGKGGNQSAFLPVKSNNVELGYDYVMYPGYALKGYQYFNKNQNKLVDFSESVDISRVVSGLYADFIAQENTVTVLYNSYEQENFGAVSDFAINYNVDNDTYLY
ncbi:MAG: hypothetical protein K2K31_01735, partial [Clostridia bacterium]|nr:hypothetical protein [Clostridia bacterium]